MANDSRPIPERIRLPETRKAETYEFNIEWQEGYLTIGFYDDGRPGEIFVSLDKANRGLAEALDAWERSVTVGLQCGVPVRNLFSGHIPGATPHDSVVCAVSQYMLKNYGDVKVPERQP